MKEFKDSKTSQSVQIIIPIYCIWQKQADANIHATQRWVRTSTTLTVIQSTDTHIYELHMHVHECMCVCTCTVCVWVFVCGCMRGHMRIPIGSGIGDPWTEGVPWLHHYARTLCTYTYTVYCSKEFIMHLARNNIIYIQWQLLTDSFHVSSIRCFRDLNLLLWQHIHTEIK